MSDEKQGTKDERLKVKEIVDESPKIVDFKTRQEWTPPRIKAPKAPDPAEKPIEIKPDPETIAALERILAFAKAGKIHGAVVLSFDTLNKGFYRSVTIPPMEGYDVSVAAAAMRGALGMVDDDLRDIAFWTKGYDPLVVEDRS